MFSFNVIIGALVGGIFLFIRAVRILIDAIKIISGEEVI